MHHQYPSKNFSLSFTHWDRALETIKPGYEDEIGRIKKEQAVRAEGESEHEGQHHDVHASHLARWHAA